MLSSDSINPNLTNPNPEVNVAEVVLKAWMLSPKESLIVSPVQQ